MNRAAVFCVFFGPLPAYYKLWRRSISHALSVDWFLITDQIIDERETGGNFFLVRMSMAEFSQFMSERVGLSLVLRKPYKVCDWRPAFACLLELTSSPKSYDFWGHTDMDIVVGDIDSLLLSPEILNFDRVFDQGHFSLYRNREDVNGLYETVRTPDWRLVFKSDLHFGFDEHAGINRAFYQRGLRVLRSSSFSADINPTFDDVRLLPPNLPFSGHIVYCEPGHVFALSCCRGKIRKQEFTFVHFQKRQVRCDDNMDYFFFFRDQVLPVADGWVESAACHDAINQVRAATSLGAVAQMRQWKRYLEIGVRDRLDLAMYQIKSMR